MANNHLNQSNLRYKNKFDDFESVDYNNYNTIDV